MGGVVEVWKEIAGMNGAYEVSNLGRVLSMPRTVNRTRAGKTHTMINRGKIMTSTLNHGYPRVTLRMNGKNVYRMCHQLVMEAFVGPPPPKEEVRHLDGNPANPVLSNLKYGPRWINIQDAKDHGRFKNGAAHLTADLVREIAQRHDDSASVLAKEFGVSISTIGGIRNRRVWKHLNLDLRPSYIRRGDAHHRSKAIITKEIAKEIAASAEPTNALAERYGVSRTTIGAVRSGRIWGSATADIRRPERDYVLRGEKANGAKLSDEQALAIFRSTLSKRKAAKAFGVSPRTVQFIRQRRTWRHIHKAVAA
jgi:hypothetical protein